jgi:hypothetical protein
MAEPTSTVDSSVEQWRPVPSREGFYSVSDSGRVRRDYRAKRGHRGNMLRLGSNKGYPTVYFTRPDVKCCLVHSVVMSAFVGPRPPGYEVNHINGIKADARLVNLEYVTPRENQLHAYRTGLKKHHGKFGLNAKISDDDVREICRLRHAGETCAAISLQFGISRFHVASVTRGFRRAHLHATLPVKRANQKLTEEQVREVCRLRHEGKLCKQIAPLFGVSPSLIAGITRGAFRASVGATMPFTPYRQF